MARLVVLLEPGVWLADGCIWLVGGSREPPHATVESNARVFDDSRVAHQALVGARRCRLFTGAEVVNLDTGKAVA